MTMRTLRSLGHLDLCPANPSWSHPNSPAMRSVMMTPLHHLRTLLAASVLASLPSALVSHAEERVSYEVVGETSFRVGWLHIYDATLRAKNGAFSWDSPFELELTYARRISENRLVDTTISEMSRHTTQPKKTFHPLRAPLQGCFANVSEGDSFVAQKISPDEIRFTLNKIQTCELKYPDVSRLFFGIWLSDTTRSDKQSQQLRGLLDD